MLVPSETLIHSRVWILISSSELSITLVLVLR